MPRQPSFVSALRTALSGVTVQPADKAAVRLAHQYAAELDSDGDLAKLGPQMLAVLTALGMTPAGRVAVLGKGAPTREPAASPLDELRQRRRARQDGTPSLDAATR